MPHKGENIYQRKDGRWEGRYIRGRKENGGALYGYVYGKSYGDCRKKRLSAIASVPQHMSECKLTAKELFDAFAACVLVRSHFPRKVSMTLVSCSVQRCASVCVNWA